MIKFLKSLIEWSEGETTRFRKILTITLVLPSVIAFFVIIVLSFFNINVKEIYDYFQLMILSSLGSLGIYGFSNAKTDAGIEEKIKKKVENL